MPMVWMLGHSDRTFANFLALLQAHAITHIVDIRAYPASRRHPQFDRLEMERRLPDRQVQYSWMPDLGGMRTPVADSDANVAWKEEGFRAYADHMQTDVFDTAWQELATKAQGARTAAMCAEAKPLQCHRQLLADAFLARGWKVEHILDVGKVVAHRLTPTALVGTSQTLTYPGAPRLPF